MSSIAIFKVISHILGTSVILKWTGIDFVSSATCPSQLSKLLKNKSTNCDETCNEYCLVFHLVTQQASILWRLYLRSNFEICGRYHWMSDPRESQKISLSITFTELILTVSLDEILSNMHCKFCQNLSTRFRVMLRKLLWTFVIPKCTGRDRDLSAMCPLQFSQHYSKTHWPILTKFVRHIA